VFLLGGDVEKAFAYRIAFGPLLCWSLIYLLVWFGRSFPVKCVCAWLSNYNVILFSFSGLCWMFLDIYLLFFGENLLTWMDVYVGGVSLNG